ncbi:MAG: phospholipase A [Vibrio sp.]
MDVSDQEAQTVLTPTKDEAEQAEKTLAVSSKSVDSTPKTQAQTNAEQEKLAQSHSDEQPELLLEDTPLASDPEHDDLSLKEAKQEELAISTRSQRERELAFDPYVITPHRMNYILPVSYVDNINNQAYKDTKFDGENKKAEAKFQISFKVPVNYDDIFFQDDALYFAFTLQSWWQVYAENISRPFRETNYRPEIFYIAPTAWEPLEGRTWLGLGIEHQSNGQSQELSRSWNRLYANLLFEKDNFALSFQPWWRLPEDEKSDPDDADGDDNPDIEHFMGHFEMTAAYQWDDYEISLLGRQNFKYHKGYAELGFTFPLYGRLRGFVQYATGYGESMIDYDNNQQRIGVGIALTDML